jgi:hypothetical protein
MAKDETAFDDLLAIATRAELRAAVTSSRLPLAFPKRSGLFLTPRHWNPPRIHCGWA